jgi:hypothetical protein
MVSPNPSGQQPINAQPNVIINTTEGRNVSGFNLVGNQAKKSVEIDGKTVEIVVDFQQTMVPADREKFLEKLKGQVDNIAKLAIQLGLGKEKTAKDGSKYQNSQMKFSIDKNDGHLYVTKHKKFSNGEQDRIIRDDNYEKEEKQNKEKKRKAMKQITIIWKELFPQHALEPLVENSDPKQTRQNITEEDPPPDSNSNGGLDQPE